MEQCQIGAADVIEINRLRPPGQVCAEALLLVHQQGGGVARRVTWVKDAAPEPAAEKVDAQNGEDEPEDEADKQNVEDGRNGFEQGVHDDLKNVKWTIIISRTQRSRR